MLRVKVIETTEKGRSTRYFQCNVGADEWTNAIYQAINEEVEKITGRSKGSFKIVLGSGYFRPGMAEIFFIQ